MEWLQTDIDNTFYLLLDVIVIDLELFVIHVSVRLDKQLGDISSILELLVEVRIRRLEGTVIISGDFLHHFANEL